jgi:hypothetical protein
MSDNTEAHFQQSGKHDGVRRGYDTPKPCFFAFGDLSFDALSRSSIYGAAPPMHRGRHAGIIVEYLQSSAKAFARDAGVNNIDLGSHLGSVEGDGLIASGVYLRSR